LVFADEVLWPGDRKAANVLKGLITESRVTREAKGVDSVEADNLNRVIIASNEDWIVPAGPQSRRWLMLNVSPKVACNKPYFDELFAEMDNGGRGALLHLLKNRKIVSNLRTAPHTEALKEQRLMSHRHDTLLHFFTEATTKEHFDTLDAKAQMGDDVRWPKTLNRFELFNEYRVWCRDNRANNYDVLNIKTFDQNIVKYGFVIDGKLVDVPTIEELKKQINVKLGV
jgi:hypothetical protein